MVDERLMACDYFGSTTPEYYRLPETYALSKNHITQSDSHENLLEQLYVALELTGALGTWELPKEPDDYNIQPDAVCVYHGKIIHWEVDRGTEDYLTPKGIKGKLDRYLKMSEANRDIRFYVGFTTVSQYDRFGKLKRTASKRASGILDLIDIYRRGDQFFVTPHEFALKFPTGTPFSSYLNPMGVSILDMR